MADTSDGSSHHISNERPDQACPRDDLTREFDLAERKIREAIQEVKVQGETKMDLASILPRSLIRQAGHRERMKRIDDAIMKLIYGEIPEGWETHPSPRQRAQSIFELVGLDQICTDLKAEVGQMKANYKSKTHNQQCEAAEKVTAPLKACAGADDRIEERVGRKIPLNLTLLQSVTERGEANASKSKTPQNTKTYCFEQQYTSNEQSRESQQDHGLVGSGWRSESFGRNDPQEESSVEATQSSYAASPTEDGESDQLNAEGMQSKEFQAYVSTDEDDVNAKNWTTEEQMDELHLEINRLDEQLAQRQEEIDQLKHHKDEVGILEERCEKLRLLNEASHSAIITLLAQVHGTEKQRDAARRQVADLTNTVDKMTVRFDEASEATQERIQVLKSERDAARHMVTQLTNAARDVAARNAKK